MRFGPIDSYAALPPDPAWMQMRPCPVCGAADDGAVVTFEAFQFFCDAADVSKRADIRQVRCRACHALFMNPCYSERGFATLFAEAGKTYGATELRKDEQLAWLTERGLIDRTGLLMDVGCHTGDFIGSLPEDLEALGVDIDPAIIARARTRHGSEKRRFQAADLTRFSFPERVTTITMFHVLEHLPEPRAVLSRLRRGAGDKTRLVVEVPLLEMAETNDINGYLTVSHLTHFSRNSLGRCLRACGWDVIDAADQEGYNGHRLLAKPGAIDTRGAADPEDTVKLYRYLGHWYDQLAEIEARLKTIPDCRRVVWGAGFHTELIYKLTSFFRGAGPYSLVDADPAKQGESWRGLMIHAPEQLADLDWSETVLLCSSYAHQAPMTEAARGFGVPEQAIHRIYDHVNRY